MEPQESDQPTRSPPLRPPLLPLAIFAACLAYFGWRFWESGEHIYGLLALVNVLGLATVLLRGRRGS